MTVAEQEAGTTPNTEGNNTPLVESGTPAPEAQVSSETYSKAQVDALIQSIKSEHGRELKTLKDQIQTVESERDSIKGELEENQSDIKELEEQLETMSKDDPDKKAVKETLKNLRDKSRSLKSKEFTLTQREKTLIAREEKVAIYDVRDYCEEVANPEVYEGANAKQLQEICKMAGVKSKDAVQGIADTLWTKKAKAPTPQETLTPYPGYTNGGGSLSDKEFSVEYAAGKRNSPEDHKRAQKILSNLPTSK